MTGMVLVLALVAIAVSVTFAAPLVLEVGRWRIRHPRVAIRAWIVALAGAVGSMLASIAVAAVIVVAHASGGVGATVAALFTWTSLATAGGVGALLAVRAEPIGAAKQRSDAAIAILTARAAYRRQWVGGDEIVFFDSVSAVACSSGDGRILISSAVDNSMPSLCVRAIIEHERAHIRLRHELVMRIASINEAAFPFLPSARAFRKTVALLIELAADDEAARLVGPATVCNALTAMAALDPDPGLALRAERIARTPVRVRTRLDRLEPAVRRRR
jgi:Zn-dependent protease with chaperone function